MMMNSKDIFNKVGTIINELNEQYDYLSQSPDNLNELELELFSAHANFLSDHIAVLIKLCSNSPKKEESPVAALSGTAVEAEVVSPQDEPVAETESRVEEEADEEEPSAWVFEMEDEPDPVFNLDAEQEEQEPHADVQHPVEEEPVAVEEHEEVMDEPVDAPEASSDTPDSSSAESQPAEEEYRVKESIISEKTVHIPVETPRSEPAPTLNDLLSRGSAQRSTGNQFAPRQVKDLKGMISMNDKLLFVRDLFNGYSLAYSEAIELLNRFDNLDSADNFLKQNYAAKNNWAGKQEVADRFYEILSQRFSK